jgi:diguanylate cyclase (GGDEF)-like protein/PAS domain S-box-containing protein
MPTWSRADICELVRGKELYGRDADGGYAEIPDWLLAASQGFGPNHESSAAAVEATHPEDRNILIGTFLESVANPGVVVTGQLRANKEADTWMRVDIEWLNLVDHEDVGCLITTLVQQPTHPVVPPHIAETGVHESTGWMVFDVHPSGRIRSVDGKVRETIGYQPNELVGRVLSELLHHDSIADGVANWVALKTVGATSTSRRPWVRKDGSHIWLESSYLNRGDDSIMAVVWDITEKLRQEQALADVTAQFRSLADEIPAAMFHCDLDGTVLFHNARWSTLVADHEGATRLHDLVGPGDHDLLSRTLQAAADERAERRTIDVASRDGSIVWRVALRPTGDVDAGRITVVGSIDDVTATVRLHTEARRDALTGVLNRHGLDEHLAAVLAEGAGTTLVVFLDLDGFKPVNDVYGHDAGDQVLAEVARRISAAIRPGDAVGRYGGDEFVVVCRDLPIGDDDRIVARLDGAIATPVAFDGGEWIAAASIGAARAVPGEDLTSVLRRADQSMFDAKRERRRARGLQGRRF